MSVRVVNLIARLKAVPRLRLSKRSAATASYLTDWKHYYQLLRISPEADAATIASAYERLTRVYRKLLSSKTQETQFFAGRIADTEEAYRVLSSKVRRAAYDQVLREKAIAYEAPVSNEIDRLVTLIAEQMAQGEGKSWRLPRWSRAIGRTALVTALVIVLVTAGGSSLALARPESALAAPFRGMAITVAEASAGAISLIEEVRAVATSFERSVVSTAVQSMRVTERLATMPAVSASTNDMAYFPSKENCLFPDYLDQRYSQFKYTVDSKGIVTVDSSWAITDAMLEKIEDLLRRLEAQ